MVRQAHHERNPPLTVRPVEGSLSKDLFSVSLRMRRASIVKGSELKLECSLNAAAERYGFT